MAELHDLKPAEGSTRDRKRVGRGPGSGTGKTAGRGQKGQKSRSGGGVPRWFEGGQMPLQRRIPKRGFTPLKRTTYQIVNVGDLARVEGDVVNPETLGAAGLVRAPEGLVKLLGNGEVERAFKVEVHAISAGARSKIEAAGGSVALLERGAAAAEAEAVEV
ncbi:MAG: 50S ribosomal protein L15, partial [Gemmatimonadetes bacterium]